MTWLRRLLDRLGGPDAVSWPLFWATFASSTIGHFAVPQPFAPFAVRVLALGIAQVAMFVPLLALGAALRRHPGKPHPWLVIGAYALATAIRAFVVSEMLRDSSGVPTQSFTTRLIGSIVNVFLLMIITTLVVSTARAHARDLAHLLVLRQQLDATRAAIQRHMTEQNEAALVRVQDTLSRELAALEHAEDDSERLDSLRYLASDVVRPLSHELAQSVPDWAPEAVPVADPHVDWRQVLVDFSRRGPFRPAVTAAAMGLVMVGPSVLYLPVPVLPFLLLALATTWLAYRGANITLQRVLRPPGSLAAVLIASVIAPLLPAIVAAFVVGGSAGITLGAVGWPFIAVLGLLIALASDLLAWQRLTTGELQASNAELARSLVRLRHAQWFHQRALARALHGAMQSAVLAAAFRLEAARERHQLDASLIDDVRSDLSGSIDVLSAKAEPPLPLDAFTEQLTQVWSRVADINMEATGDAREALEASPILRAMVMEIASESVSNAIRHGRAESIRVSVGCPNNDELSLEVRSDGQCEGGRTGSGLGSKLLDDCTLSWQESSSGTTRLLVARFPRDVEASALT